MQCNFTRLQLEHIGCLGFLPKCKPNLFLNCMFSFKSFESMSSRRETRANANVVAEGQLDNETPLSPPPPSLVPPVPPMGKGAGGVPQAP
ncbi:hypothetical protein V6N12_010427 [Hibiscus sabdariffa]|uniref:Uncharacterized protein n=1 Tax=Hibiscus sabdariffa TaxID=183260 RepID=A0ABR2EK18_9ROSI